MCDVVRIELRTNSGSNLELSLFSVPMICGPLSHQPIAFCKAPFDHLAPLCLADLDDGATALQVDIFIRSDHYRNITTGDVV